MSKKILVTGGAGYIGSHVVNLLGKAGYEIVVIDNLSTGFKEAILYGKLYEEDLNNLPAVEKIIKEEKFDGCIHFAGSIIIPESVENPLKYYKNNTVNSCNLVELCSRNNLNNFIFSSTAAVYGIPKSALCNEEDHLVPINPYGRSKLMTEWTLEDTAAVSSFNFVALRYFNVAGASIDGKLGQRSPLSTHLIKIACETACAKRDSINIFGTDYDTPDGTCIRDYIHIDDLAQAHIDALEYLFKGGKSEIMNCGYGHGFSVREVIKAVKDYTSIDFKVIDAPRRAGDPPALQSSVEKIKRVLGWRPKYDDLNLIVKTAYLWEKNLK